MKQPNIVETKSQLSIIFGKIPYVVSKTKQKSKITKIRKYIREKNWKGLEGFLNPAAQIETYTKGEVEIKEGFLKVGKEIIPDVLARRLIEMKKKRVSHKYLMNFWKNLKKNPSEASQKQLFGFLEANHFSFTQDGRFVGYKKVTKVGKNLKDSYSKTINNNVGKKVKMDREKVNPNPDETCSYGLHVGAWGYVSGFNGDTTIEVLVNPRDVVAVPRDYNNEKMRVCEYEVLRKTKAPRTQQVVNLKVKASVEKRPVKKKAAKKKRSK